MKRASYRDACEWIAQFDEAGNGAPSYDEEEVAGLVTVVLLADIFDVESARVARDVVRRRKALYPEEWQRVKDEEG